MKLIIAGTDIETTGLLDAEHRIIEVHITRYLVDVAQPEIRDKIDERTWRIDPERKIPKKSFDVHGICEADLVGCPTFEKVAPEISHYLNECDIVVAHNGLEFDFPFLIQEFERVNADVPNFEPMDTMTDGRFATFFGKSPSLKELCFACGVDYDEDKAHAADYDVDVMMQCFFFALARNFYVVPDVVKTAKVSV